LITKINGGQGLLHLVTDTIHQKRILGLVAWSIALCSVTKPAWANGEWMAIGENSACYYYQQQQLTSTKPCKLSYANKIGLQTLRIDLPDEAWSGIEKLTQCDFMPDVNFTVDGYCRFFVNGRRALRYHRSSLQTNEFGHVINEQGDITCYQIQETKNSVCTKL
jgi:hypothetical protein